MELTPPVRVTAPSLETARRLERRCDGLPCTIDPDGDGWRVTISRIDAEDGNVATVLDAVRRWLRETDLAGARVELGDQSYVMERD